MYKDLKRRIFESLKSELDFVSKFEKDTVTKCDKMLQIKNMLVLFENYEQLEPKISKEINKIAREKKFKEER